MTITHCLFTLRTGGAQLLMIDLLNEMCRTHTVSLIVVNDDYSPDLLQALDPRVAVYCLERAIGSRNPIPVLRLTWLLHRLQPDVIHCHERKMIQLIRYGRARTLYTVHDMHIPVETFGRYDALVAISEAVARDILSRSGTKATVIYNGIPVNRFRRRLTHQLTSDEPLHLVQVSRLMHEKKGQDILIHAVAQLIHERVPVRLTFVGSGESLAYLQALTQQLGVTPYVTFAGEQDREWIGRHLADYHVLVQPSRYEGFGLTVAEGLAADLPVLASNIEGPAEIIRGIPAGRLFASKQVADCGRAIRDLHQLYVSGQVAERIAASRPLVDRRFSIQACAAAYAALYSYLMQHSGRFSPVHHSIQ